MERYIKTKFVSSDLIEELIEYCEQAHKEKAGIADLGKGGKPKVDKNRRNTIRYQIDPRLFPELTQEFLDHFDNKHLVRQMDCLLYEEGCHFKRHKDTHDYSYAREWSVITLIDKSEDLEGGDLIIYKNESDEVGEKVQIEIGESVLFKSNDVEHQITPVTKGWRNSLVTWLF